MSDLSEQLSRFLDGQTSAAEAEEIEARLAEDPEAGALLAGYKQSREHLIEHLRVETEAADLDVLAAAVLAALPEESPAAVGRPAVMRPVHAVTFGERVRRWLAPLLVGAAVAAAATWALVPRTALEAEDVEGGPVMVDAVRNNGPQVVLISQPAEEGGATVIWMLEDELDEPAPSDPRAAPRARSQDGEPVSPLDEDPI
jgi:anti-sigma factor RsiW